MHFYGWKKGLKTGMYYLRTRPAVNAIQFTVDASVIKEAKAAQKAAIAPSTPRPIVSPSPTSIAPQMAKLAVTENSMSPAPSPTPSHYEPLTPSRNSPSPPSDNEEITYEEAKRRQEERALAALQCSIDNKDGELLWTSRRAV